MLEPIKHILAAQRIVLASGSPRRYDILKMIGLQFEVHSSQFEEKLDKAAFAHPCEYVKENAKQKAIEVWGRLAGARGPDLVIGADTVVTLDGDILEKPRDDEHALQMLRRLSGQRHTVFTGVALVTRPKQSAAAADYLVTTFHESTDVTVAQLSDDIIRAYVATGEPADKAGAYAIQCHGATLIEQIRGDYYNVVGLPLHRLCREMYILHCDL